MPAKITDLDRMLCHKLAAEVKEDGKHTKYTIWHEGRKLASTLLSRSYSEIDDSLLSTIARQLGVNRQQLRLLIECPMSRAAYIAHVLSETK